MTGLSLHDWLKHLIGTPRTDRSRQGHPRRRPTRLYCEFLEVRLTPTTTPPNFVITDTTSLQLIPPSLEEGQLQCDGSYPDEQHGPCFADGLAPSYYRNDGNLALFTSQGVSGQWLRTGPDLPTLVADDNPFQRVTIDVSSRLPDEYPIHPVGFSEPAIWIEGVWSDGNGNLYALYHDENAQPCYQGSTQPPGLNPWDRVGMAKSVDDGLHWTDLGIILKGVDGVEPRCDVQSDDTAGGVGDVTLYVDTRDEPNYVYVFFSGYDGALEQAYQGVGVARMPLADIDHPRGQFQKWYQGQWADASAGPGGPFTPIFPAVQEIHPIHCEDGTDFVWGPHVYFDGNAGQYVMLLNRTTQCYNEADYRVSFSADLSNPDSWTRCTPDTPATADACDLDSRLNYRPFYVASASELGLTYWYAQVIGLEPGDTSQDIADSDVMNQPRLFQDFGHSTHLFHVLRDGEEEPSGDGIVVRHTHDLSVAASFYIDVPTEVTAGVPFDITVYALDAYGNLASGYTGTISFYSSSDPYAALPADYTFTSEDGGVASFPAGATLYTARLRDVSVYETTTQIGGTAYVSVAAGAAAWFYLDMPAEVTAGEPFDVTVYALDAYRNLASGYTGTISFYSSSDPYAALPADYSFTTEDGGIASFPGGATLYTAGIQDVSAYDTATGIGGRAYVNVIAGNAAGVYLNPPAELKVGEPFDVTPHVPDAYGDLANGYAATVSFSSREPGTVRPPDYASTPEDANRYSFPVTLVTPGTQALVVVDDPDRLSGGQDGVEVTAPCAVAAVSHSGAVGALPRLARAMPTAAAVPEHSISVALPTLSPRAPSRLAPLWASVVEPALASRNQEVLWSI